MPMEMRLVAFMRLSISMYNVLVLCTGRKCPARPGPALQNFGPAGPARPVEVRKNIGPSRRGPVNKKPGPARPGVAHQRH